MSPFLHCWQILFFFFLIPKKLYCFKWQNVIGFCGAPGRAEGDLGWGCLLQKSNAFIKKTINWYQKKTQGGLQEEAEREAGRQRGTNTVEDRRGGAVQGSWDADTKCMSGPPPKPSEADGQGLCWQVLYR